VTLDTTRRYPRTEREAFRPLQDTGLSGPYLRPGLLAFLTRALRALLAPKGPK
jgi:hypothetical protein